MDPRQRADALLARARARGAHVVTPDNATSPMDSTETVKLPRVLVNAADPERDTERTMVLPANVGRDASWQAHSGQLTPPAPQAPIPPPQRHPQPHPQQQPVSRPPGQQHAPGSQTLPGIVPTVPQPGSQRPSLTERLNGELLGPAGQGRPRDQWPPDQRAHDQRGHEQRPSGSAAELPAPGQQPQS